MMALNNLNIEGYLEKIANKLDSHARIHTDMLLEMATIKAELRSRDDHEKRIRAVERVITILLFIGSLALVVFAALVGIVARKL